MKKKCKITAIIAAASLALGGALISCSPHGSGGAFDTTKTAVEKTATKGSLSGVKVQENKNGTKSVSLTAKNGTYKFNQKKTTPSAYILANVLAQAPATVDSSNGSWDFYETGKVVGKDKPKLKGSFTGDISTIGKSATKLNLKVTASLSSNGKLVKVKEEKNFDFDASDSEFEAEIPEIEVDEDAEEYELSEEEKMFEILDDMEGDLGDISSLDTLIEWLNKYAEILETDTTFEVGNYFATDKEFTVYKDRVTFKADGSITSLLYNTTEQAKYAVSKNGKFIAIYDEGQKDDEKMIVFEVTGEDKLEFYLGGDDDDEEHEHGKNKEMNCKGSDGKSYVLTIGGNGPTSIKVDEADAVEVVTEGTGEETKYYVTLGETKYELQKDGNTIKLVPETGDKIILTEVSEDGGNIPTEPTVTVITVIEGGNQTAIVPLSGLASMEEYGYTFYSDEDCTFPITNLSTIEADTTIYTKMPKQDSYATAMEGDTQPDPYYFVTIIGTRGTITKTTGTSSEGGTPTSVDGTLTIDGTEITGTLGEGEAIVNITGTVGEDKITIREDGGEEINIPKMSNPGTGN